MADNNDIFNIMYGQSKNAVFIYGSSGELLWLNLSAELISEEDSGLIERLRSEIMNVSCEKQFRLENGICAKLRRIQLNDREYFAAELYSASVLDEFFCNPIISDFSFNSDAEARKAITGISAACELIEAYCSENIKPEITDCLNRIMKSCCRLLQNTSLYAQLAVTSDSGLDNVTVISIADFLDEITDGFRNALSGCSRIKTVSENNLYVKINKKLLTFFLVNLLKQILVKSNSDITISASDSGERINIKLLYNNGANSEFFSETDNEINKILAKKLGIEYSCSNNGISLILKAAENDGTINMDTDRVVLSDNFFSIYNIMLSDLDDFRDFYSE